jgi:hypothetical protein
MPFVFGDITDYTDGDKLEFRTYKWIARGHFAEITLEAAASGAFAFNWQNPHANKIIVTRCLVYEKVAGGTAGALLDIGSAANTGVHSDDLIDGMDANAVGVYDNIDDPGVNGNAKVLVDENGGATDWVTCQVMVANALNLEGTAYLYYIEVL